MGSQRPCLKHVESNSGRLLIPISSLHVCVYACAQNTFLYVSVCLCLFLTNTHTHTQRPLDIAKCNLITWLQMQQAHYACCMFTYSSQESKLLRKKTCSGAHGSWGHRKDFKGAFQTSLLLSVDAHIRNDRNHTNKSKKLQYSGRSDSGEKEPQCRQ